MKNIQAVWGENSQQHHDAKLLLSEFKREYFKTGRIEDGATKSFASRGLTVEDLDSKLQEMNVK